MSPETSVAATANGQASPAKLGEVLVDVRNLKMYFPITEGVMISRVVA